MNSRNVQMKGTDSTVPIRNILVPAPVKFPTVKPVLVLPRITQELKHPASRVRKFTTDPMQPIVGVGGTPLMNRLK
jgi:hypothetical protein